MFPVLSQTDRIQSKDPEGKQKLHPELCILQICVKQFFDMINTVQSGVFVDVQFFCCHLQITVAVQIGIQRFGQRELVVFLQPQQMKHV
jgi:hypothetical protein